MLVLSMDQDDRIIIPLADGTEIELMLVSFPQPGRARVGITAPKDVPILRSAIYDRIVNEGRDPRDGLGHGRMPGSKR
jgi:sRNA-binding carbon storage regulator CsrA